MLYRPRRPYPTITTGVAAVLTMYSYDAYRKRGCSADLVIVIPYQRFVMEYINAIAITTAPVIARAG